MRKVQWVLRNIFTDEKSPINSEVFSIGRDRINNIVCKNLIISREHAKIYTLANNKLQIVNCSATNSTYVNNEEVSKLDLELHEKDEIGIGVCMADYKEKEAKEPYYIFVLEKVEHNSSIIVIDDEDSMVVSDNNESFEVNNENKDIRNLGNTSNRNHRLPETANTKIQQLSLSNSLINNKNGDRNGGNDNHRNDCLPGTSTTVSQKISLSNAENALINNKNEGRNGGNVNNRKHCRSGTSAANDQQLSLSTALINNKNEDRNSGNVNNRNDCLPGTSTTISQKISLSNAADALINTKNEDRNGGNVNNRKHCRPGTSTTKVQQLSLSTALINNNNKDRNSGNDNNRNRCLSGRSATKVQKISLSNEVTELINEENEDITNGGNVTNINHCQPGTSSTRVKQLPLMNNVGNQIANSLPSDNACNNAEDNMNPIIKVKVELNCDFDEYSMNTSDMFAKNNNESINNQPVIDVDMETEESKDIIKIIDDEDDDEYDFMCSQMYIKTEECEKPDEQTKVGDVNFLLIKKELAEMDDYDKPTLLPPIDIDYMSMDNFDLQKDLEDIAEETIPVAEPELQPDKKSAEEVEVEQSSSVQNKLTKVDQQLSSRKTELIAALPQPVKRRRSSASACPQDRKKVKVKEKAKPPKAVTSKEETDRIKEARKDKLKQIEQSKKTEPEVRKPFTSRLRPASVYVKVSSGRGDFLTHNSVNPKDVPILYKDKQSCISNAIDKYGDIIEVVLDWKFTWFKEYSSGNFQEFPPITKKPIIKMCNTYSNFKNYYDVLQPLLVVDYWFNLSSEIQNNSYEDVNARDHFYATADFTRKKPHSEMLCTTYITSDQKLKKKYVREQNIITIATRLNRRSAEPTTLFGVVIWVKVDLLHINDKIDMKFIRNKNVKLKYKITFLALVNINEPTDNKLSIFCRYFSSFNIFLKQITAIKLLKNSSLLDYILYPKAERYLMPSIQSRSLNYQMIYLNIEQKRAVLEGSYFIMDKTSGIYMINGPPGTGKSTVITNIILEALLNPNFTGKILLLAHSNCAIDALILKLIQLRSELADNLRRKIKLLRIGYRASAKVERVTLDCLTDSNLKNNLFQECPQVKNDYMILYQEMKKLQKMQAAEPNDETEKKLMIKLTELSNFCKQYLKYRFDSKYEEEKNRVLNGATVICSTIGSVLKLNHLNFTSTFNVCILDEATQCTEPEALMSIYLGVKKMILVGDTKQLPAITSSMFTKTYDYHVSLFSRIEHNISKHQYNPILTLKTQYRMHPEICLFPSKVFYDNVLRNDPCYKSELEQLKPYIAFSQDLTHPNLYYNTNEVDLVLKLIGAISEIGAIKKQTTLGIITVYSKQKEVINTALTNRKFNPLLTIQCSTVDGFQGQEMDIIIFSAVRIYSNRFSSDVQRINVSFTRAKHAFYIIACKNLFDTCSIFKEVKSNAISRNIYYKVKETTTPYLIDIIKRSKQSI